MIQVKKIQRIIPERIAENYEYICDICDSKFISLDSATEHHIISHIQKMDIPGVGTAYLLTTTEEADLFWKSYKRDNGNYPFADEDKVIIVPGLWHMIFTEERPFRNEHDEWYWIAPLINKIPILRAERASLLEEIKAIDRSIKEIYEATR